MKKGILGSNTLIILGFIFECLHFTTDLEFFHLKFWILGLICISLGILGFVWYIILPVFEEQTRFDNLKRETITRRVNQSSIGNTWVYRNE